MTVHYPDLAIIGRAGAGKSTVAEMLLKQGGYDERLSFAGPLKVMCGTTTDRELLQIVGVGVRALVPDGWVNLLEKELLDLKDRRDNPRVVIDDCRFPNEAQMLLEWDFRFIRVEAPRNDRVSRLRANGKLTDESQLTHISETALDAFTPHHTIVNDGSPEDLWADVVAILNKEAW